MQPLKGNLSTLTGHFYAGTARASDSDARAAEKALDILHDCVMWVYVFTGPEQFDKDNCQ
jgi:hypothetical protein